MAELSADALFHSVTNRADLNITADVEWRISPSRLEYTAFVHQMRDPGADSDFDLRLLPIFQGPFGGDNWHISLVYGWNASDSAVGTRRF